MVIGFGLSASGAALGSVPQPAAASAATETPTLDEVLVTGERAGPGMWRVSKVDHELWILGVQSPLPKELSWRYTAVNQSDAGTAPPARDLYALVGAAREIPER